MSVIELCQQTAQKADHVVMPSEMRMPQDHQLSRHGGPDLPIPAAVNLPFDDRRFDGNDFRKDTLLGSETLLKESPGEKGFAVSFIYLEITASAPNLSHVKNRIVQDDSKQGEIQIE